MTFENIFYLPIEFQGNTVPVVGNKCKPHLESIARTLSWPSDYFRQQY